MFRVLFTFPSRYWFTIGLPGVFSLGGWSRRFQTGFLVPRPTQGTNLAAFIPCKGLSPAMAQLSSWFQFCRQQLCWPYNPNGSVNPLVWADARSLAATSAITLVFSSSGYLDVSVRRVCPPQFKLGGIPINRHGLPHSDTCGSHRVCRSPQLFAAYHVLLRLWEPRHPPYALIWLVCLMLFFLNIT